MTTTTTTATPMVQWIATRAPPLSLRGWPASGSGSAGRWLVRRCGCRCCNSDSDAELNAAEASVYVIRISSHTLAPLRQVLHRCLSECVRRWLCCCCCCCFHCRHCCRCCCCGGRNSRTPLRPCNGNNTRTHQWKHREPPSIQLRGAAAVAGVRALPPARPPSIGSQPVELPQPDALAACNRRAD